MAFKNLQSLPLTNKIILITGANQGLGYGFCLRLASLGATIIMLCRNESKAIIARDNIISKTQNTNVYLDICDLSSKDSIYQFIENFKKKYLLLDVLINNAGTYNKKRTETKDGFESTFGVNYLAHFYLTLSLIPLLRQSQSAVVLNITSNFGQRNGKIDFQDINKKQSYSGKEAYNQSKLAIVISTINFRNHFINEKNISFFAVCPAVVRSNIIRDFKIARIFWKLLFPFIQSPEKGAETGVKIITNEIQPLEDEIFFRKGKSLAYNSRAKDLNVQEQLWNYSVNQLKMG